MTPQQFRKSALSLPDTVESEHMGHPEIRSADHGGHQMECSQFLLQWDEAKIKSGHTDLGSFPPHDHGCIRSEECLFFGKVNWYNHLYESPQHIISRPEDRVYSFRCQAFAVACDGAQNHQHERCSAGNF